MAMQCSAELQISRRMENSKGLRNPRTLERLRRKVWEKIETPSKSGMLHTWVGERNFGHLEELWTEEEELQTT